MTMTNPRPLSPRMRTGTIIDKDQSDPEPDGITLGSLDKATNTGLLLDDSLDDGVVALVDSKELHCHFISKGVTVSTEICSSSEPVVDGLWRTNSIFYHPPAQYGSRIKQTEIFNGFNDDLNDTPQESSTVLTDEAKRKRESQNEKFFSWLALSIRKQNISSKDFFSLHYDLLPQTTKTVRLITDKSYTVKPAPLTMKRSTNENLTELRLPTSSHSRTITTSNDPKYNNYKCSTKMKSSASQLLTNAIISNLQKNVANLYPKINAKAPSSRKVLLKSLLQLKGTASHKEKTDPTALLTTISSPLSSTMPNGSAAYKDVSDVIVISRANTSRSISAVSSGYVSIINSQSRTLPTATKTIDSLFSTPQPTTNIQELPSENDSRLLVNNRRAGVTPTTQVVVSKTNTSSVIADSHASKKNVNETAALSDFQLPAINESLFSTSSTPPVFSYQNVTPIVTAHTPVMVVSTPQETSCSQVKTVTTHSNSSFPDTTMLRNSMASYSGSLSNYSAGNNMMTTSSLGQFIPVTSITPTSLTSQQSTSAQTSSLPPSSINTPGFLLLIQPVDITLSSTVSSSISSATAAIATPSSHSNSAQKMSLHDPKHSDNLPINRLAFEPQKPLTVNKMFNKLPIPRLKHSGQAKPPDNVSPTSSGNTVIPYNCNGDMDKSHDMERLIDKTTLNDFCTGKNYKNSKLLKAFVKPDFVHVQEGKGYVIRQPVISIPNICQNLTRDQNHSRTSSRKRHVTLSNHKRKPKRTKMDIQKDRNKNALLDILMVGKKRSNTRVSENHASPRGSSYQRPGSLLPTPGTKVDNSRIAAMCRELPTKNTKCPFGNSQREPIVKLSLENL